MKKKLVSLLIPILFFTSCTEVKKQDLGFKQGTISYKMEYLDLKDGDFNKNLLPNQLIIQFNEKNVSNKVTNKSGIVNTSYICNNELNKSFALIKFLNKKLIYFQKEPTFVLFEDFDNLKIKQSNETVEVAGHICSKAIATYTDSSKTKKFEILYIADSTHQYINKGTPYDSIKGILMDFRMKILGKDVRIVAEKLISEKIDNQIFEIPENYEEVNKETLYDIIGLLK